MKKRKSVTAILMAICLLCSFSTAVVGNTNVVKGDLPDRTQTISQIKNSGVTVAHSSVYADVQTVALFGSRTTSF